MHPIILIILAVLVLSVLVLVHEFGHFVAAKLIGVWPEEFGIGLPPRAWGKKIGETIYSVNWLPLGGFVRLHGESADARVTKPERAFVNASKLKRAFVALAGITMNFLFAWVCFSLMFLISGVPRGVSVVEVEEGSPAEEAGVMTGDTIYSLNDQEIIGTEEFLLGIRNNRGKLLQLSGFRGDREVNFDIAVRNEVREGQGFTGITYDVRPVETEAPNPINIFYYGARETVKWSEFTVEAFSTILSDLGKGQAPQGLAGPFGVTLTIAEIIRYGIVALLSFTGIISVNLALVNIIPFPPLDGSRVLLLGVEAVVGKKNIQKVEGKLLTAGMAVLLLLIAALTLSEIPKLLSAGSISGFVDSLFVE
jgi:regulator of sigma E protease